MSERLEIGSTPFEEEAAQLGTTNYSRRAKLECIAYIAQLRRMFGPPPDGATYVTVANSHDFGTYYEVGISFKEDKPDAVDFAFNVEASTPGHWDDEARAFLAAQNY